VRDVPFRPRTLVQLYRTTRAGDDHMTTYARWLAIQNGVPATVRNTFDPVPRYIHDGRGLGEYVHGCQSGCPASPGERMSASPFDASFFAAVNAALLLLSFGPEALDEGNPYAALTDQSAFATFGPPHALDLVTRALNPALKAAWYQKWLVHRRVRPEEYAGRVHNHQLGLATYPIPSKLLHSQAVADVFAAYGSYLLPMAYPEGCPTHPAYPSGHATFAGACVTMLKAFFEESFPFPEPQVPTDDGSALVAYRGTLTVGGELNKLASNIAGGRLIAGVHWRSDATAGLRLGEAVAISILSDLRATHAEEFGGFTLTTFDGTTITI
jgi:membrane-associated phospholipid phosphatase